MAAATGAPHSRSGISRYPVTFPSHLTLSHSSRDRQPLLVRRQWRIITSQIPARTLAASCILPLLVRGSKFFSFSSSLWVCLLLLSTSRLGDSYLECVGLRSDFWENPRPPHVRYLTHTTKVARSRLYILVYVLRETKENGTFASPRPAGRLDGVCQRAEGGCVCVGDIVGSKSHTST